MALEAASESPIVDLDGAWGQAGIAIIWLSKHLPTSSCGKSPSWGEHPVWQSQLPASQSAQKTWQDVTTGIQQWPGTQYRVTAASNAPPRLLKLCAFKARSQVTRLQPAGALMQRTFWSAPLPNLGLLLHQTLFRTFSFLRSTKLVGRLPTSKTSDLSISWAPKHLHRVGWRAITEHRRAPSSAGAPHTHTGFTPLGRGALPASALGFWRKGSEREKKRGGDSRFVPFMYFFKANICKMYTNYSKSMSTQNTFQRFFFSLSICLK